LRRKMVKASRASTNSSLKNHGAISAAGGAKRHSRLRWLYCLDSPCSLPQKLPTVVPKVSSQMLRRSQMCLRLNVHVDVWAAALKSSTNSCSAIRFRLRVLIRFHQD
jgi:hypothetical protein